MSESGRRSCVIFLTRPKLTLLRLQIRGLRWTRSVIWVLRSTLVRNMQVGGSVSMWNTASPGTPQAMLRGALESHLDEVSTRTSEIAALVDMLPERLRHWVIGEAGATHAIPVERWTGPWAAEYAWRDLFLRRRANGTIPREVCGMFPDISRFKDPTSEGTESFVSAVASYERARSLFQHPLPSFADEFFQPYLAGGAQIKTHRAVPSWLWVDSDSTVAFPDQWGEANPTSVTLFHSPVLASIAIELFEHLWAEGRSLQEPAEAHWDPFLHLMYQGSTIESASRKLAVSPRTGRRRIAEAMEYYGVESIFELGFSWGADIAQRDLGSCAGASRAHA